MIIRESDGYSSEQVNRPSVAARLLRSILESDTPEEDREKEHFWVIGLNQKNHWKYVECVSIGSMTNCFVHPREIFRQAVIRNAGSILAGHNHPSGDTEPSNEDIEITEKLKQAGEVLGIALIDHIIIGHSDTCWSLFEHYPHLRNQSS